MVESRQPAIWCTRQFTLVVDFRVRIVGLDLPWIFRCFQRFHRW